MLKNKILFCGCVLILMLFSLNGVVAAELFFSSEKTQVQVGERIAVKLFINTQGKNINAYDGNVVFNDKVIKVLEVKSDNSVINLWIEKPRVKNNTIIFSGITPGGFKGTEGLVLTAILEGYAEGETSFEVINSRSLLNDGLGTEAPLTLKSLSVEVVAPLKSEPPEVNEPVDVIPPDTFVPEISRDEILLNKEWFVVFDTKDKDSGTESFEVKEVRHKFLSLFKKWSPASSPYVLEDQERRSFVYVKAIDKAGNYRIQKIPPQNPLKWYEDYINWIIVLIATIFIFIFFRFFRQKKQ